jgi:hypothetical protein
MLLAWVLVTVSIANVRTVAAIELPPRLLTLRCGTDSKCGKGYECVIPAPGIGSEGFCVPKGYSNSNHDEEECLHKANCAAAGALRRACPACAITPIMTCGGAPSSDAWYRERWERLKDCFNPTPEQVRASAVPTVRTPSRKPNPGGPIEIQQAPDLNVNVNQWNIRVPAAWAGSGDEDSSEKLYRRKGHLENTLSRLWEFNAACPIYEEDIGTTATTTSQIAGTCGAFRNPDPTKPPPSLNFPSSPNK